MTNPVKLAKSLIGKHRISKREVEDKVNNIRLVDEILRKHGYRKVFASTSAIFKGWAISERFTDHNEYLL
ncbi:hypothetical protein SAMN02745664_12344 [Moraxella cuniculi DSM 21768]|uniref:Uncharacterized protein n=1 Tax=Moraxella cuniculi DSM 21768 TaxID=1122245 RepID=A0A1N7G573_9GAMM|nr:hypothetical protein [Moraxella cuniculi]OOS03246.1 hypothetical protein B0189_09580 [Moraxella cuniculi]SIS07750.1 hypothetical protein SAMN02745664_12344 [Moraxella cuniculi DSM 21768]